MNTLLDKLKFVVPALMLGTAIIQFAYTFNGLTRWKGGGYGMYSELKYTKREIWLTTPDTILNVNALRNTANRQQIIDAQIYPSEKTISRLDEKLSPPGPEGSRLYQVYLPYVNFDSARICKRLVYTVRL